ncbi:MAG: hypothetical protein ACTSPE_06600 [Candidatus Thorarchaeota archaeon]
MSHKSKAANVFFVMGVLLAAVGLVLYLTGNAALFQIMVLVAGPLVAMGTGLFGLRRFARGGIIGHDQFSTMNGLFALGLTVLSLSELLATVIALVPGQQPSFFTVTLLQFPGVLLWVVGAAGYYHACLHTIGCSSGGRTAAFVSVTTAVLLTALSAFGVERLEGRDVFELLAYVPTAACLIIAVLLLLKLGWTFRGGRIRVPLFILAFGAILFLIQIVLWGTFGVIPIDPVVRALAVEAYVVIGIAHDRASGI